MAFSTLEKGDILPRMHDLLVVLIAHAQGLDIYSAACRRLVRTIARLARTIMLAQVTIYQARLKTAMLADPDWRARVIRSLGGWMGLEMWRRRSAAGPQVPQSSPSLGKPRSPRSQRVDTRQFRLAPLPGHARGSYDKDIFAPDPPYVSRCRFSVPIPVTPDELCPAGPQDVVEDGCYPPYSGQRFDRAERPPPKPIPP